MLNGEHEITDSLVINEKYHQWYVWVCRFIDPRMMKHITISEEKGTCCVSSVATRVFIFLALIRRGGAGRGPRRPRRWRANRWSSTWGWSWWRWRGRRCGCTCQCPTATLPSSFAGSSCTRSGRGAIQYCFLWQCPLKTLTSKHMASTLWILVCWKVYVTGQYNRVAVCEPF